MMESGAVGNTIGIRRRRPDAASAQITAPTRVRSGHADRVMQGGAQGSTAAMMHLLRARVFEN